nr:MAG TPA: hypothetical protein [Microviridae sp.]
MQTAWLPKSYAVFFVRPGAAGPSRRHLRQKST